MIIYPEKIQHLAVPKPIRDLEGHFVPPGSLVNSDLATECVARFLMSRHLLTKEACKSEMPTFDPTEETTVRSLMSYVKAGNLKGILSDYAGTSLSVPKGKLVLHRRHVQTPLEKQKLLKAVGEHHSVCFSTIFGIALAVPPAKVSRNPSPVCANGQNYLPVRCKDGQVRIFRLTKAGIHDQSWTLFGPDNDLNSIPVGGVLVLSTRIEGDCTQA